MTAISMVVNGTLVAAELEPRTLLADFLRETLYLTGTHVGCAQGVCGACTLLIDGRPQRSCITFAITCDGAAITTIEGLDDDPIMAELREAFAAHHALQCGFCTPGMLTTARDIVLRLGDVSESRIRDELSGNLCRCTGYVGIIDAVRAVCAGKSPQVAPMPLVPSAETLPQAAAAPAAALPGPLRLSAAGTQSLEQRIPVAIAPGALWSSLSDLRRLAACLPGAEIETLEGDRLTGRMRVSLGPIKASFRGEATMVSDEAARTKTLSGRGRDGGSAAEGELVCQVLPEGPSGSVIAVTLSWRLTGALAQFARTGLVHDIVRRLTASFAANLEASLAGAALPSSKPVGILALIWSIVAGRFTNRH